MSILREQHAIGGRLDRVKWKLTDNSIERRNRAEQGFYLASTRGDLDDADQYMELILDSYSESKFSTETLEV